MCEHPLPVHYKENCDRGEPNTSGMGDPSVVMPADIHLSADGRFLYVSNRSVFNRSMNGSISSFVVREDGRVAYTGTFELDGGDPRGFAVSPRGGELVVGLLDKNRIDILETDGETGVITGVASTADSASPASFVWVAGR